MRSYWFNKNLGLYKLMKVIMRDGLKEKIEKKFLNLFIKLDFFLVLEIIYKLQAPFRFYKKKRQIGRHSFKEYKQTVYILKNKQQNLAVKSFFEILKKSKKKKFKFDSNFFFKICKQYLKKQNSSVIKAYQKQNWKEFQNSRVLHHFRWKKKKFFKNLRR